MRKVLYLWCLYSVNLCNGELKIPYETEMQEEKNKTKHKKETKETKQRKKKERLKSNFPSLHCCHWPFSNWKRITHLQSPSKLTEKRMDKVRQIIYPKFRPFHFQIKTYYLSGANYPTDNPSQTDNPSLV